MKRLPVNRSKCGMQSVGLTWILGITMAAAASLSPVSILYLNCSVYMHLYRPGHPGPTPQQCVNSVSESTCRMGHVMYSEYQNDLEVVNEQLDQIRNQLLTEEIGKKGPQGAGFTIVDQQR